MKALVYLGPEKIAFQDVAHPKLISPTDAIVRITHTTICGTDLHILKGDLPEIASNRILGHEGVGIIESVGTSVTFFKPGEKVIISCISSCGICEYCRRSMTSHCTTGGWILGHTIDGTQSEFVRIPHANTSLHHAPPSADDEQLVLLSDVLPTAYECGVLSGQISPGNSVAIIGAGPIGLAVLLTALLYSPADLIVIDSDTNRLQIARTLGATLTLDNRNDAAAKVMQHTQNRGVDVAVEAVGIPQTFELCQQIIAPGGRIANVGVHGALVPLHLEKLWSHNITLTTRLVDATTTPLLLKALARRQIKTEPLITHRFALPEILAAYKTFARGGQEHALKVILKS